MKQTEADEITTGVSGLAIATGIPAFAEPLHVGRPNVPTEEALFQRFRDVMASRWFTNHGPMIQEFGTRLEETLEHIQ